MGYVAPNQEDCGSIIKTPPRSCISSFLCFSSWPKTSQDAVLGLLSSSISANISLGCRRCRDCRLVVQRDGGSAVDYPYVMFKHIRSLAIGVFVILYDRDHHRPTRGIQRGTYYFAYGTLHGAVSPPISSPTSKKQLRMLQANLLRSRIPIIGPVLDSDLEPENV